jgi:hypothetical protein
MFSGGPRLFLKVQTSTLVALAGSQIFSIIIQVCLAYNVILDVLTVVVVPYMMGSIYLWTKAIPEGPYVNPGRLGRFSNIFNNYASLLCFQL